MGIMQQHKLTMTLHLAIVALLLIAFATVASASGTGSHGHEGLMEEFDADGDDALDNIELGELLEELVDDPHLREECPDAAALIAEFDGDSSGKLEEAELEAAYSDLLGCVLEATTTESILIERDGVQYTCHAPGGHGHEEEEEEHEEHEEHSEEGDEHAHDHSEEEEEAFVVTVAGQEWECDKVPAIQPVADTSITAVLHAAAAIAAVSLLAVIGFALSVPFDKCMKKNSDIVASFAMGSLLAAIFLHMLPELVAENAGAFTASIGIAMLGGFFASFLLEQLVHFARATTKHEVAVHAAEAAGKAAAAGDLEAGQGKFTVKNPAPRAELQAAGDEAEQEKLRQHLASGEHHHHSIAALAYTVTLGDLVHNFVDGILIAVSFQGCDTQLGWTVAGAVALHEIPQEIGDFLLLKQAGLSTCKALLLNLLAALGAFVGMLVAFVVGTESTASLPIMLAIGAGQLLFVAATDILPTLTKPASVQSAIASGAGCCLGIGLVALTLLHDVHCEAGSGHAHAH